MHINGIEIDREPEEYTFTRQPQLEGSPRERVYHVFHADWYDGTQPVALVRHHHGNDRLYIVCETDDEEGMVVRHAYRRARRAGNLRAMEMS